LHPHLLLRPLFVEIPDGRLRLVTCYSLELVARRGDNAFHDLRLLRLCTSIMSDVNNTAATAATTEPSTTTTAAPVLSEQVPPVAESAAAPAEAPKTETAAPAAAATTTEAPAATATAPEEKKTTEEKVVEPISEGLLAYKGPGLVKSLIPSKKIFWLSDEKLAPQDLHLYLRGEKPEVAHGVVAWASQTGKGLLFFNKKDDTDKTKPQSVLPLYEATELKKVSPHEITFEINSHKHTLKAANDAERDGWYLSLERAVEVGKAEKENIRSSQGYKDEMEKLGKPNTVAAGAAGLAGAAAGKKSVEEPKRANSDDVVPEKQKKSRSTSRGILGRFQNKKEEAEAKKEAKEEAKEEKKAEKEEAKEEKKIEKEEKKAEKEAEKAESHADKAGEAAATAAVVGGSTLDAQGTAERAVGAPVSGETTDEGIPTTKAEETKPAKRGSIFGRLGSNFSGLRSPNKEKDAKEVELKPEVPAKDNAVSETAPQIPEPTTETATETPVIAGDVAEPKSESKTAEAAKEQLDAVTPSKENKSFLSGFTNKLRNRSVSPSANMKEAPKKEEATTAAVAEPEAAKADPVAATTEADKPLEPVAASDPAGEKAAEPAAATPNKRESVFQGLGRRASKAFKSFSVPQKKENEVPATTTTEAKKEEAKEAEVAAPAAEESKPVVNGESKPAETIGDVVPEAVSTGHPQSTPTVTASA
ncbi:mediator of DNA damage checkpoint protein 1-like, partial [Teratosphaeria destructans]